MAKNNNNLPSGSQNQSDHSILIHPPPSSSPSHPIHSPSIAPSSSPHPPLVVPSIPPCFIPSSSPAHLPLSPPRTPHLSLVHSSSSPHSPLIPPSSTLVPPHQPWSLPDPSLIYPSSPLHLPLIPLSSTSSPPIPHIPPSMIKVQWHGYGSKEPMEEEEDMNKQENWKEKGKGNKCMFMQSNGGWKHAWGADTNVVYFAHGRNRRWRKKSSICEWGSRFFSPRRNLLPGWVFLNIGAKGTAKLDKMRSMSFYTFRFQRRKIFRKLTGH